MTTINDPEAVLEGLSRRYANWDIHISATGRWWAMTRERTIAVDTDMRGHVDADSAGDLEDLLIVQERLRGRHPALPSTDQPIRDTA